MFEYFEPESAQEAISLLGRYGEEAKILAGGTELLVNVRQKAASPKYLVNIKKTKEQLSLLGEKDEGFRLGPLCLLHDIEQEPYIKRNYSAIHEAAHQIGSFQIRNMATLGGNICQDRKCVYYNQSHVDLFMRQSLMDCWARGGKVCHAAGKDSLFHSLVGVEKCWASCSSDMLTALSCFDATIEIRGKNGVRTVQASSFWTGPDAGNKDLGSDELVTGVKLPHLPEETRSVYLKYKKDPKDFAIVSVAARMRMEKNGICEEMALYLGGIAPVPYRAVSVEEALKGKQIGTEAIVDAVKDFLEETKTRGPAMEFKVARTRSLLKNAMLRLLELRG